MRKLYRTIELIACAAFLSALAACNTDYNFDEVSLDVTIGSEGMNVPLGNTGNITLSSLLEDATALSTDADGYYTYTYSDDLDYTASIGSIAPIENVMPTIAAQTLALFDGVSPAIPSVSQSQNVALEAPYNTVTGTVPTALVGQQMSIAVVDKEFTNNFEITLPEQVAKIKEIKFGSATVGSPVSITLNLGKLDNVTENKTIESFTIEFPAGFTLALSNTYGSKAAVGKSGGSATNNKFTLTDYAFSGAAQTLSFYLVSADVSAITPPPFGGR